MEIYVVRSGDSLYTIARRYGTSVDALSYVNQLNDPSRLVVGQSLVIPGDTAGYRRSIEVNAYDYPNVSSSVLAETLPYFTTLCPFSNEVRLDGDVQTINDTFMIERAYSAQTAPMLTITNIGENGGFSGAIAHAVLTDETAQSRLFEKIVALLREKGYYGLNVNFEYVYTYDKGSYSQFIGKLAELLHPLGYMLATAIAPKESAAQSGIIYTAHDYEAHGKYADRVILMTYEWGYTYSAPQAVSPVNRIRRVLDYAVTVIPSGKILMGYSNYGYDWTLPWKQGNAAKVISNTAAQELAVSRWAEIKYDETAQAPWFNYTDADNRKHVVWFEDARSARARLRLVEEYDLAGISIWTANRPHRAGLYVLESMYSVEKLL